MITLAYQRGYAAGKQGARADAVPYAGHNDGSLALQLQWMTGWFDAITGHRLPRRRRNLRPRKHHARVRWPKSLYVRRRLEELFHISIGGFSS